MSDRKFVCRCKYCGKMFKGTSGNQMSCERRDCKQAHAERQRDLRKIDNTIKNAACRSPKLTVKSSKLCPCGCKRPMEFNRYRAPGCPQLQSYYGDAYR